MTLIHSEMIGRVHLIRLPWNLDRGAAEEFARQTLDWKKKEAVLHILELSEVQALTPLFYRSVTDFRKQLHEKNIALFSVGASTDVAQQLGRDGMLQLFSLQSSLKEAVVALGLFREKLSNELLLDHTFFKPLINGVRDAIQSLNQINPAFQPGDWMPPRAVKDPDDLAIQMGAVAEIVSARVEGKVALYFTKPALQGLFVAVAQKELDDPNSPRAQDLAREILNMAVGHAKSEWNANHGLLIERNIPMALVGDHLQEHLHGFVAEAALLPIKIAQGRCYLGITVSHRAVAPASSGTQTPPESTPGDHPRGQN